MKRLTYKDNSIPHVNAKGELWEAYCDRNYNEVINRLAAYEDAEEQGLLVRLPCNVGDRVFYITGSTVHAAKADMFMVKASGLLVYCDRTNIGLIGFEGIFGKTVFLSREEAEAALKGEREDV